MAAFYSFYQNAFTIGRNFRKQVFTYLETVKKFKLFQIRIFSIIYSLFIYHRIILLEMSAFIKPLFANIVHTKLCGGFPN